MPLRTLNRLWAVAEVVILEVHQVMETLIPMGLHPLRLRGHRRALPVSPRLDFLSIVLTVSNSVVVNDVNLDSVVHHKPKSLSFHSFERR